MENDTLFSIMSLAELKNQLSVQEKLIKSQMRLLRDMETERDSLKDQIEKMGGIVGSDTP